MCDTLAVADFIEADITYDENTEYRYLLNVAAFNEVLMQWMVVARICLDKENSEAYRIAFQKVFSTCTSKCPSFSPSNSLKGIVIDWSKAEMNGIKLAIVEEVAERLLRGCRVHWIRSCQRVSERVSKSTDKTKEKVIFRKISSAITVLSDRQDIIRCFKALCGEESALSLTDTVPGLTEEEATFVDYNCDWTAVKHWASWWIQPHHLRMLCGPCSKTSPDVWKTDPLSTNAVEGKNSECKANQPVPLKAALINVYKINIAACCKHITAIRGASVTYRNKVLSQEPRMCA